MKKNEVTIGSTYQVKVSGTIQDVRITGENRHGGWDGVNEATGRSVRIKSAQRLRSAAQERPTKRKKVVSLAEYEAQTGAAEQTDQATPEATGAAAEPAAKKHKPKADKPTKEHKPSGLDAAAQVLAEAGEPLNTKTMVERMLAKGLWSTGGKTPAATIYASIITEIAKKGDASRFRKTDRGHFELTQGGKEVK